MHVLSHAVITSILLVPLFCCPPTHRRVSQEAVDVVQATLSTVGADGAAKDCDDACQALIEEAARRWRNEEGDYRDDVRATPFEHLAPCTPHFQCLQSHCMCASFSSLQITAIVVRLPVPAGAAPST